MILQAYCRGYVIIADEEDIGLKHAMMLTPSLLKQHMVVFQVGYTPVHAAQC